MLRRNGCDAVVPLLPKLIYDEGIFLTIGSKVIGPRDRLATTPIFKAGAAMESGSDAYLTKPFAAKSLIEPVARASAAAA
jgi:hypothetical protein